MQWLTKKISNILLLPGGYRPKDQYETDSTRPISLLVSNTVSTLNRFHEDKIPSI